MKTNRRMAAAALCLALGALWSCGDASQGSTVLHWAAGTGNLTLLKTLVETKKADVEVRDAAGRTPLLSAAEAGKDAAVEYLIQQKASVTAVDKQGRGLLHYAAARNDAALISLLLGNKYRTLTEGLLIAYDTSHRRPIETAQAENRREAAVALITAGSPVDGTDGEGMTLLHWAAKYGYDDVAQLLITKGVDLNGKDRKGRVPLHIAASQGNTKIVEMLVNAGADASIPWPRAGLF